MSLIYLACPYTGDAHEQRFRLETANDIAARLTAAGFVVFNPLGHGSVMMPHLSIHHMTDHGFWMKQCIEFLRHCEELYVIPLNGWRQSRGVAEEIKVAESLNLPVTMVQLKGKHCECLSMSMTGMNDLDTHNWRIQWL